MKIINFVPTLKEPTMIVEKTRRGLQTAFVMMFFIFAAAVPAVFAQSGDMPLTASKEALALFKQGLEKSENLEDAGTLFISSKAEEIAGYKNDKSVTESAVATDMNIRIEGNSAVVTGVYRTKGRDEKGQPFDRRIRYTDTYIKRDGRWQVWASQGTLIP